MNFEHLKPIIQTLPNKPGVYQYYDKGGKILYVGKAKDLKKRVSSYFTKTHDNAKTHLLVKKIDDIKHIVVDTETDAFLLENSLIKKYQPRYNIMLKDDKTYPWLCIKKEHYPRVFLTRNVIRDGSEYFGPYASVRIARSLLDLIKALYPIRTCQLDLHPKKIALGKYKVCLEYHIGNCKGGCEGWQVEANYQKDITEIRNIVKGNFKPALVQFHDLMQEFAGLMQFEEAQKIKEKIELLANYQARSTVVNPSITNVDVFNITSDEGFAYVNFFKIMNGSIIQSHTTEIKKKLDESDREILELAIVEIRQKFHSVSREIYVPFEVDVPDNMTVTIPKIGDKKHILDLSLRNAKYYKQEQWKQQKMVDPERHTKRILAQMQKDLRLPSEPVHIECFDNSNIQGTNPVAACVVFKNAKPSKQDYRKFNIKTVEGPNDFASMEEIIFRRYSRLLEEKADLPQLIVIDGGKGQLGAALKSLDKLGLRGKISIIGIAKRLEEIYYPDDPIPMYLDKTSESLKVIQHLRNEAHRFGITFHRDQRSKNAFVTELELIPGVGEQTVTTLLKSFKSVKRIKEATLEQLTEIVGISRANKVFDYYQVKKN